jgi:la-related protein 6
MDQPASSAQAVERSKAIDVIQASTTEIGDTPSLTEHHMEKLAAQEADAQEGEEDDDSDPPLNLDSYQPASEEILSKLLTQAEFYFSDSNVLKDKFLMKNIQKNKGGFISVKLLSSFRRMQAVSKDWRDLAYSLRRSEKLELNELGNKVRRKDPLPQWDDSVFDRTVIAINLQLPEVSVNAVKSIFGKCGAVTLVRVLQPGKNLPDDLRQFAPKHPELSTRVCAVVEFAKDEEAQKALKELGGKDDWRGMQVLPLRGQPGDAAVEIGTDVLFEKGDGAKIVRPGSKGKENVTGKMIVTVDSSPTSSPSSRRKKTISRSHGGSGSGGIPIPDKHKLDAFGGRGSPSRSPHGGRRSPKPSSYAGSGDEFGQDRFDNRTTPKPIPGRMQQHRGTPIGSPDTRSRGADESPLSCSPVSLGTSPWIRRRALMEQADPSSSPGRNLITVSRQPRGPNGSKGFSGLRPSN